MIYSYSPGDTLSQGDILRDVQVIINVKDPNTSSPKYDLSTIIVVSRNCEIDKPIKASTGTNTALVARVIRLASAPSGNQGSIRKNSVLNALFLPAYDAYLEECYVDWRTLQPVDKENLLALRSRDACYKCSLKKESIEDCFDSLFLFLTKPEDE